MWKDPEPDPGGDTQAGASSGKSVQELSDLKDQNEQQQLLIAQLKEMLRKEQSNVTQEKVEEYINTLSRAKAKKNRTKKEESGSVEKSVTSSSSSVNVAKKQKLNLLKQQLEENKARLAERGKSQKGIEEMVIQLKAQLNDSQQLIPANLSLTEPRNLDYSKHSSQEELYNILLTKEKKITDLLNKVQKQEATIIDLEENVKEKDSVIDARTKAITLMTDSLSKKGKSTLDALDDTKEQMRKMQENFVTLESEMKARQVKLLNDLKAKNLEIAELQEVNQKLAEDKPEFTKTVEEEYKNTVADLQKRLDQTLTENEVHLSKVAELEKKLQDSVEDFNRLKNTGLSVDTEQTNDEEIAKLKKQLEENNKNMIKAKAQSKSKIKELNKKLDQIKKANDANALIVQLQNENTKLGEKIAELEEEKGNMQLKMVESLDSIKDSEEQKELENKLTKYAEELEEKEKVISLLETEIISRKQEIDSLNEKISGLSHLENVQVSSEIKSIQLEEQLEKADSENLKLKEEIEELLRKGEEMAENMEELKKEKQDVSSKLDNYIQENMELIDKLEKLSAEKVSSAESIEIVEGLTQQEKLELAAYQKTVDGHIEDEPIKCTEDDHIEPPTELNESVLQLGEDSTELLQKIDMFNMERKEVMVKMEALREENGQLNAKIKEVENNRDILAETYEQLQTEKELLQAENDGLLKKLHEAEGARESDDSETSVLPKLQELQEEYEKLLAENEILKGTVKEYDRHVQEKHDLESELKRARERAEALETKIRDNLEEINNYQSVMEENKNELINSANLINELQTKLQARERDVADLTATLNELNAEIDGLRQETYKLETFEYMENEIANFKTAYAEQIQKIEEYEEEIARNNDMNTDLNAKLIEINRRIMEAEHDTEMKDIEYKKLAENVRAKDETIRELQHQLQDKDGKIGAVIQDMKEKYLALQKKLDGNSGALEARVMELTNKNREQMDKMKKIAANLKKKSQAYQELEEKYNADKEKWETELNEKQSLISTSEDKMATILRQLKDLEEELRLKNAKLLDSDIKIRELAETVENLERNRVELQQSMAELKHREHKTTEVSLKQELSTSLHEDFDGVPQPNRNSVNEEKIKEMELIIETNEADIAHYRERIQKLQENIARLEQEKESLVQRTAELNDQLNITSKSVEEHSFVEEELGQKLLQVTANDEALTKTLEEVTEENRDLNQRNKEMEETNLKLKVKLKKAHERVTQLKALQTNVEELETTNGELKKQLASLEANQRQIQDENLELQRQNQTDYEKIEADYQVQLEELVGCRHELTVECEKLRESLKEMGQREEELAGEIAEDKQKIAELEANNKEKLEELADELRVANFNWKDSVKEIDALNQQIEFLEKELVDKIARETVESIITEAENRVGSTRTIECQTDEIEIKRDTGEIPIKESIVEISSFPPREDRVEFVPAQPEIVAIQPEIVPTFHWPGSQQPQQINQASDWFHDQNVQQGGSNDWFHSPVETDTSQPPNPFFAPPEAPQSTVVDNSKEELLNKIKALEFLLYNIDKEKEEAFRECTGMVNELTRLVYEKVNPSNKEETSATSRPKRAANEPISELESQIMSELDVTDAAANIGALQNIEFEKTIPSLGEQSHPVIEEVAQPKRAYLTYQPDDKNIKPEAFGENDDGWGWGPEEAKLEEEHQSMTESDPRLQSLRSEISRLNETLQVLQVERENHLEEIKQLQVKSGKLIKKCRELKQKNDHLIEKQQNKKTEGADFFDLDAAIQDELKAQIAQLEKKIKEVTNELEKEKQEKANVLKRVDVLASANDRMTEMKEIQDTEVLRWKRKHEELQEKLQQYEWGSDGFNEGSKRKSISEAASPAKPSSSKEDKTIEELHQTIKELALDNEELQALLEEQRQIRMDLEKAKPPENDKTEEQISIMVEKIRELEQELSRRTAETQTVLNERNSVYAEREALQKAIQEAEGNKKELQENLRLVTERNVESEKLNEKIMEQDRLLQEKETALKELISSFEQVNSLKEDLDIQARQLANDLERQREKNDELQVENDKNVSELQNELVKQRETLEKSNFELERKISELQNALEQQKRINDVLQADTTAKLHQSSEELEEQKQRYERLHLEYTGKVAELAKALQELQNKDNESAGKDTFEWAQEKHRLESLLTEKESVATELRSEKETLERQIGELKHSLDQKQKDYEQVVNEAEERISITAKELEESWVVQVDQRGADIAESWKLHLESVEAEYTSVQQKLKFEIDELEEKCNALVNENNELRKNVDAEIRNEVDRISALQQQITDCQRYITELNKTLMEKQSENESLVGKLTAIESEKEQLSNEFREKERKLSSLSIIIDTTQKQFDEKREVVEAIVQILERGTSFPISFEKQDILDEFQRQLGLLNVKEQEILKLHQFVENLQNQLHSTQDKEGEIFRLNQLVEDLQNQLESLKEKDHEISRLKRLVDDSQSQLFLVHEKDEELFSMNKLVEDLQKQLLSANEKDNEINGLNSYMRDLQQQLSFLEGKDAEIVRLNEIIENYKVQEELLQEALNGYREQQATANSTIENYQQRLEEFGNTYVTLQNSLEEKNQLIATLNQQLQLTETAKDDNNKDVEKLQEEISQVKKDCSMLQQSLAECQEQLFGVRNELTDKTTQLENVNRQLAYSQQNLEIQDGELQKFRDLLAYKEQEYSNSVETVRKSQFRDLENHYEELLAAKDLDIETVKSQLNESIQTSNQLTERITIEDRLRQQLQDKVKELEGKTVEQSALLDEEDKQLTEMRGIIEQQVIKIEELKKELFAKSSDYDGLIAEMDIGRKAITQQPAPSPVVETPAASARAHLSEEDLSEPVSRAELDLALYMLHQRDVRCEELTVELTQLLEERDTLQLRLSNALREKEEIRRKMAGAEEASVPSGSTSNPTTPRSKSSAIFLAASGTELATEPTEGSSDGQNLESKLSELRKVGYKKDKTFVDEQEFRRFQQMSIMQQHMNEASKLPPEAAAKLVDASYTLSRDVQSPSKVLLNWLWGRSTPKVNDT